MSASRARRLLGLTYAAERYGERSRPSPFLFELAGEDERLLIWTGPKLKGADDRLTVLTRDEPHRMNAGDEAATDGADNRSAFSKEPEDWVWLRDQPRAVVGRGTNALRASLLLPVLCPAVG